ncbi:hypothetical protein H1R20_g14466, partial [Candolleomyces eurysporus]
MIDLEPSNEWKLDLEKRVEDAFAEMAKEAGHLREICISLNPEDSDQLLADYADTMDSIRKLAKEQYLGELGMERQKRRRAAWLSLETNLLEEMEIAYQHIKQSGNGTTPVFSHTVDAGSTEQVAELEQLSQIVPNPEIKPAQTTRRPMLIAPQSRISPTPPNVLPPPPRSSGTSTGFSARNDQSRDESLRRRAFEIEEKRMIKEAERQRAEREGEQEVERIKRAREEEERSERIRREEQEVHRLENEREHTPMQKGIQQTAEAENSQSGGLGSTRTSSTSPNRPFQMPGSLSLLASLTSLTPRSPRPIDPTSTVEQRNMVHSLPTGVEGQATLTPPPRIRGPRERLHGSVKRGAGQKKRVMQQRDKQKRHEHELERGREKEWEKQRDSQGEQEGKNRKTEKMLHELEGAGGKAENAPRLAQKAESKRLVEGQAEELTHQEAAERKAQEEQRELERQHSEALESQQPDQQVDKQSPEEMAQIECEERDRAMQAVPVHEFTKKWKATLQSRIDQEIGILVQLNT